MIRETEDHSIVEEEVRAGRMTAEQAATHPSKNVISRALGAEESVEVDMKTFEVEEGTCFLLCSDGITRHIADSEIRGLLIEDNDLGAVCAELKRRCYERGAERLVVLDPILGTFQTGDRDSRRGGGGRSRTRRLRARHGNAATDLAGRARAGRLAAERV